MAKKAKAKQPGFSVAEWAPLDEAFARGKAALGSSDLALRDLHGHMLSGRLPSAVRRFERDGTEVFEHLESSFWEALILREGYEPGPDGRLKRSEMVRVHDRGALFSHSRDRFYFVSRRVLDELYATCPRTDDAPTIPVPTAPEPQPAEERKPAGARRGRRPILPKELRQRGIALVRARQAETPTKLESRELLELLRTKLNLPDTDKVRDRRLNEDIIKPAYEPDQPE
jgi:hypothetical protein